MLRTTVTDVYGDAVEMEAVEVDVSGHEYGEFACDAASANAYGPFRVEAWVEDADGEHASPVAELVVYRLRRPRYWLRDAPHSPFGVHTNSTTRHCAMAKAVGINWTRLHDAGFQYLGWRYLEPKRGQWAFRDADINRYRTHRIKVLGELGTAPKWASYHGDVGHDHIGYFDQYYQPKRLEDYANYVRTVVQRYQGVIDAYDVWNEPWIPAWWAVAYDETKEDRARYVTSKDPAGDFVALMKTAYKATKAVDEAITILGVNTTAGEDGREWTRGIVDNGGINYSDVVCYHQYTGADLAYPGDAVADGYETAVGAVADRYGEEAPPVWMSEGSSTAGRTGSGMYRQTIPYEATEDVWDTGDRLCRYVVSLLSQGVEKVFLYSMHSHRYFTGEDAGEWRVLTTPEGALNPSGAAHSTMAWHLEDTAFSKRVEPVEGVHAYLFEGTRGSVAVLAPMYEHAPYRVPAGPDMTTTDLFGNPLRDGSGLGATVVFVSTPNGVADLEAALRPAG
ncbi:hypothetical protein HN937_28195 [Candidatus Poribacteria bacterium]|nr:hypothetical protein [Candidatus Poribacteria bacterium]